ncbi:erythrocyte membrane protein 1, PfEMP1, putative [Plasmodium gaboni]|uniref:Erythrocyte membrane protein 1, PfEMP1, putative n=1 Tax=Plasmodium gaboni TaxID=647221 RepID=A0ABY1ULT2_9APIC|nr:erythrocyte membrane protein 1, PfEMP1, putative [Plasmodium gaboni]
MSTTTTSPSNISTQCQEVKEILKNVDSSTSDDDGSGGQTFVKVCMRYDRNLDAGKKLMEGVNGGVLISPAGGGEDADKELMKSAISGIDYKQSKFYEDNRGTCKKRPCGENPPSNKNWIWKEAQNGNAGLIKDKGTGVGLPPRTQVLCFGNLHGEGCKTDVSKIIDSNVTLLTEWIIAAKIEGENLKRNYGTNNNDKSKLCKALGYSYADIGDLIKGTSIWQNKWTEKLETNLNTWFKTIFKDDIQENGQTPADPDKYPNDLKLLREVWWNRNKKYIWGALQYGATNQIDNEVIEQPTTDYIPQFLRFSQEWVEHFCDERKKKADDVVEKCKTCVYEATEYHSQNTIDSEKKVKGKLDSGSNGDKIYKGEGGKCWMDKTPSGENSKECNDCKSACTAYKTFVEGKDDRDDEKKKWRDRWQQMEDKYTKLMTKAKEQIKEYHEEQRKASQGSQNPSGIIPPYMEKCGTDQCVKNDIDSFFQNLHDKGITTLSGYMSSVSQDCGSDKPKWGRTTVVKPSDATSTGGGSVSGTTGTTVFYPQPLGDRPAGYKYACLCIIPSREELCADSDMYNTRWKCDGASGSTAGSNQVQSRKKRSPGGTTKYDLCHDKTPTTTTPEAQAGKLGDSQLSEDDVTFFSSFQQWYKDIQNMLDHNMKRINDECDQDKIMKKPQNGGATAAGVTTGSSGSTAPSVTPSSSVSLCLECRNSCECYKLWVRGITEQWNTQKTNYDKFEKKQKKTSGQKNGQNVTMDDFLFSSCWEDYLQKTGRDTKDISELSATTHGDMIDVLTERCGENSSGAQTKFDDRIKNAENQTTQCNKKQERCRKDGTQLKCEDVGNNGGSTSGCREKTYDNIKNGKPNEREKSWDCNGKDKYKDVCVPPRTQTLCVANMHNGSGGSIQINDDNINTWKQYIEAAMKKETENLYQYYNSKNDDKRAIISKKSSGNTNTGGSQNSGDIPHNFCLAAQRTYNDFKHMVLGDIPWDTRSFKEIGEKIKEVLQKQNNGETPEKWWDEHSDKFWDAIKCGIQKQKKTNGEKFSGEECGVFYPPESDTYSQFVWWFKEWGQEFCVQRNTLIDAITKNCDSSDSKRCPTSSGTQKKTLKEDCKKECDKYQKFIEGKKNEWNKQKSKYEREHPGEDASQLFVDFDECGSTNFEKIFGPSGTTSGSNTTYFDASDICSCTEQRYKADGKHPSTCQEKRGDLTSWSSSKVKRGTNGQRLRGVFAPPRRQKLCLANLFPINFGTNASDVIKKNTLENRLRIIAEREAYYLWLQHVKKENPNNPESHHKACCAIRSSFYDIGDIVKGTDLWDDLTKKYIDEKLNEVFGEGDEKTKKKKPDEIKLARKKWWEYTNARDPGTSVSTEEKTIRFHVWDAMQFGAKNAMEALKAEKTSYDQIDCLKDIGGKPNIDIVPTPQFARWLIEWTHQFCEEYTQYIGEVVNKCGSSSGNDCNSGGKSGKNECKDACTKYTNWINIKKIEWNGMRQYYEKVKGKSSNESEDGVDYSHVMRPTAIAYLNQNCDKEINGTNKCCYCKDVGTNPTTGSSSTTGNEPLKNIDQVVALKDTRYKKYRGRCTDCQLKHIKEQIETITKKIEERDAIKQAVTGTSGTGDPGVAKPAPAKPVAAKPAAVRPPAAAAAKPSSVSQGAVDSQDASGGVVSTKPEVPRPQAKVDSPPGASGNHTSVGQGPGPGQQPPPPPQQQQASQGNGTSASTNPNTITTKNSYGTGILSVNYATPTKTDPTVDQSGKSNPTPVTSNTATSGDPNSATSASSSSSSSSSSSVDQGTGSGSGGTGGAPGGQDDGKAKGAPTTTGGPSWYQTIKNAATIAGIGGLYGTLGAIDAVKGKISDALKVAQGAAEVAKVAATTGIDVAKNVGTDILKPVAEQVGKKAATKVFQKIDDLISNPDPSKNKDQVSVNPGSNGSNSAAGAAPPPSQASTGGQPGNSGGSLSSGTGSTGTQNPQGGSLGTGSGTHSQVQSLGTGGVAGTGTSQVQTVQTLSSTTSPGGAGPQNSPSLQGQTGLPAGTAQTGLSLSPTASRSSHGSPQVPDPTQNDDPTTHILNITLPVGLSFALGSIALLFYLKKKPKLGPTKLFRVLDIPQNDYNIPTNKSTNRYVPYSRYKGKTYLYVEGDEPDDYIRDISSSDITSSSESEVEELDINDIYPYKSPKYKTLIEVVLKPSINNNVEDTQNTHIGHMEDKATNTPINDNEWNELKHDFISQYLQNVPKDLPNENITDDHMDMVPNIIPNNMEEKSFIISIEDRDLHGDGHIVSYNIDWNVPKNITTNTTIYNSLYRGIDLINDSLNGDNHINIYDELLKRKENELFGTKHPKSTN